ncbi:MAG: SDR family oxidoreductase [Actinobacteria bacterium]|nr:SDR family oxidoreductase [Actinomycetota bacterium]
MSEGEQRIAAVTGASGGIGRAIALRLAATGAMVEIASRNEAEGAATVAAIEETGGIGRFTRVDVAIPDQVEGWIAELHGRRGRLDWLVNNAGTSGGWVRIEDQGPGEFERLLAVNVLSACCALRAALPLMRAQGHGSIVNVGSTASVQGIGMMSVYSATKHAILGLTRGAALENADVPIRVNCICPGIIDTDLMREIEGAVSPDEPEAALTAFAATVPMKRYGSPAEIAAAVEFLLGEDSGYVTGTGLTVDGGVMSGV